MSEDILQERLQTYDKNYCWQYYMRLNNLKEDVENLPTDADYEALQVKDFTFRPIESAQNKAEAVAFIKRHEWLGTITQYTTHYFGAYYNDILAGVITFSMPNSFSKLMGDDTKNIERLISRGACISWSPKCLASSFLMWCIKWMVKNTDYRLFTAYSDPTAKELGTIYQACNFYYLGQKAGTTTRYINPYTGKLVSDRFFRQRSAYRKFAKELGIEWDKSWVEGTSIKWERMPTGVEAALKAKSKETQRNAKMVELPSKHKYAYVLGKNKNETKRLRAQFLQRNKVYPYPKERGV